MIYYFFRTNFGVKSKFSSSVSSIYPDNSLLSFEDYDAPPLPPPRNRQFLIKQNLKRRNFRDSTPPPLPNQNPMQLEMKEVIFL